MVGGARSGDAPLSVAASPIGASAATSGAIVPRAWAPAAKTSATNASETTSQRARRPLDRTRVEGLLTGSIMGAALSILASFSAPDRHFSAKLIRDDDTAEGVYVPSVRPMRSPWTWSPNELDRVGEPRLVLVLTRKAKQSIMIGDEIEVRVLSNDGTKVRLGIQAPSNVPVHRTEVYLAIQAQGRDCADSHEQHDLTRTPASRQSL